MPLGEFGEAEVGELVGRGKVGGPGVLIHGDNALQVGLELMEPAVLLCREGGEGGQVC